MPVRDQIIHFALLEGHQAGAAREVADELIASLGLQGREQALVQDLSLGNQQRVQLAVALVGDPALLVLDEPFSGLDPIAVETMSRLIREQADRGGVGVLFSSHQLELVERLCDKVCILDRGRVTASGSVVELQDDGKSRWRLAFSRTADSFAAEVSMARGGVNVEFSAADRTTVLVSVDGSGRDVPGEILAAAQRHGGLKSIVSAQRSLADLLAGKFISSGPGITTGGGALPRQSWSIAMSATTFDRTTRSAAPSSGSGLRETRLIIRREILTRLGNRTILTATGFLPFSPALLPGSADGSLWTHLAGPGGQ